MVTLVFLIYITNIDNKIYYVALGDSLAAGQTPYGEKTGYGYTDYVKDYLEKKDKLEVYTKGFAISGYRTTDLMRDINDNKKIKINDKSISIKQALIKADIVTLSIGANDLFYKLGVTTKTVNLEDEESLYQYIDEIMKDMDQLLKLVRQYCKEDIILVGYYNPFSDQVSENRDKYDNIFRYANEQYKKVCDRYKIHYVDIYNDFNSHKDYLPNPLDVHPSTQGYEAISKKVIKVIDKEVLN